MKIHFMRHSIWHWGNAITWHRASARTLYIWIFSLQISIHRKNFIAHRW